MFHCAVSSRKNIEIFKNMSKYFGQIWMKKNQNKSPPLQSCPSRSLTRFFAKDIDPPKKNPSLKRKALPLKEKRSPYQRHADKVGLGAVFDLQNQFYVIW